MAPSLTVNGQGFNLSVVFRERQNAEVSWLAKGGFSPKEQGRFWIRVSIMDQGDQKVRSKAESQVEPGGIFCVSVCQRVSLYRVPLVTGVKRRKSLKRPEQLWVVYSFSVNLIESPSLHMPLFGHTHCYLKSNAY